MSLTSGPSEPLPPIRRTVYLVRHGEAMHNIEERHAKKRASEEAEGLGHSKGTEVHKAMCEAARVAVLENEEFRDASLSDAGVREAVSCEEELQKLLKTLDLKEPGEVLVSPLQRTLQTASAMFPNHEKVRVCELLRERQTGRPCDDSKPSVAQNPSFAQMDWSSLMNPGKSSNEADTKVKVVEDVTMLRRRTGQLADVLHGCSEETVCIITHKGYLRELERGPLMRPEAAEFGNCEVRIYDVVLPGDGTMAATLCFCEGNDAINKLGVVNAPMEAKRKVSKDFEAGLSTATATNEQAQHRSLTETKAMQYDLFKIGCTPGSTRMPSKEVVACF